MGKFLSLSFVSLLSCVTLIGCKAISSSGVYISSELIQAANSGSMTKQVLFEKFGTPTYQPDFSKAIMYYVFRKESDGPFSRSPAVIEQRVVKVVLNDMDIVTSAALVPGITPIAFSIQKKFTPSKTPDISAFGLIANDLKKVGKTKDKPIKRTSKSKAIPR